MNVDLHAPTEPRLRKPLHLCLFTDSLQPSGLGEHMLTLAAEFADRYRILFVCPPSEHGDPLLKCAEALGCVTFSLQGRDEPAVYAALGQALIAAGIQIFHCHAGIGWEGHLGIYSARQHQIPAIIRTEHLPYLLTDPAQCTAYQKLLPQVDHVICVSAEAYASYRTNGLPNDKLAVVRNGIRPPTLGANSTDVRSEFGLTPQTRLILTVARLTEQKGHNYLLDAIPPILRQEPDVTFLWVGDGPQQEQLLAQRQKLGINPARLIFTGWRQDVPNLLQATTLFVLPSLFEGLPLVVLEAMAMGIPVIATNVSGSSEVIKDGICGRLVPPQDSNALCDAILEALAHPQKMAGWAVSARWRFHKEFSAQRMANETEQIYQTVLANNTQKVGPGNQSAEKPTLRRSSTTRRNEPRRLQPQKRYTLAGQEHQPERNP